MTRLTRYLLFLVLGGIGFLFAAYTIFGAFRPYDDEGYMMNTVQLMLEGHTLYGAIPVGYGPFYYFLKWLIHQIFQVPLGNDSVRITSILIWIGSAALFAATAYRFQKKTLFSSALACVTFVACVMHLRAFANEPGHPQEIVVMLLAIGVFAGFSLLTSRVSLISCILGCCVAAMILTKINVGVFFLFAALLAMLAQASASRPLQILHYIVLISALLLPLAVLRPHLHQTWAQRFCFSVALSLFVCWIVGNKTARKEIFRLRDFSAFLGGLVLVSGVCVVFVLLGKGSVGGLVDNILLKLTRFPILFGWPIEQSTQQVFLVVAGSLLAVFYLLPQSIERRSLIEHVGLPLLKLILGLSILLEACEVPFFRSVSQEDWPLSFAAGFFWLVLVPPASRQFDSHEWFSRRLLALTASLQLLQLYPVPGSQRYTGTITIVLLGACLLGDVGSGLERLARDRSLSQRLAWLRRAALGLAVLAFGFLALKTVETKRLYSDADEVHLPGSTLTRMPEVQAITYRFLADTIHASADTFVCKTGLNSLYFWSQTRPASTVTISHSWQLFDAAEQKMLLDPNEAVSRLVFIDHPSFMDETRLFPVVKKEVPLLTYVEQQMVPQVSVGGYQIYTRKGREELVLRSCAYRVPSPASLLASELRAHTLFQISIPSGFVGRRISRVELLDSKTESVLCSTSSLESGGQALLLGRGDEVVLSKQAGTLSVPSNTEEWTFAIPANIQTERIAVLALRFYDGADRLFTVPVVRFVKKENDAMRQKS